MSTAQTPTSVPVFRRVLTWSAVVAAGVAVIGGAVGFVVAGFDGMLSALVGAGMTLLFAAITVVSLLLAAHLDNIFFMAVVLGAWLLKFVLFLGIMLAVKDAAFVHQWTLWGSLVAAVVGTLVVDVVCVVRARIPNTGDVDLTPRGERED
ncbi:hypothetical protein F8O01_08755 [Pseudoclavibacter chungangensis]|uniref:Uncharacterized protein n=1 Tax=Pseudoclavibacter chungangensis TaxID=587635 RepID=A0A7J5BSN4_9MICO|nr:hypothetical protein [Pseudoclavibacter chungangensis]KAB1657320.1 hypothetical protein F8O01_08755 [Pseudoclavibacter chungangensis]NYJ66227.1 magnesium-transporting ATPase (P-type) [Pseudoclavibacter chungangensis]